MSLNRLISEHVETVFLNTEHFAETLTLNTGDTVVGLVELDTFLVSTDRQGEQAGRLHVKTTDAARLNAAKTLVYEGHVFHINGEGTPQNGMVVYEILRTLQENGKSNIYDINDEQAEWHE